MPRETSGAGWIRSVIALSVPLPAGTGAVEALTDLLPGFRYFIEKVTAVVTIVGAGTSATRVINIVKGASTVVATLTLPLADATPVGVKRAFTLTAANAEFNDADTLTVDFPSAGAVAFTSGEVELLIQIRQRPQQL